MEELVYLKTPEMLESFKSMGLSPGKRISKALLGHPLVVSIVKRAKIPSLDKSTYST